MTNEEAIKNLKKLKSFHNGSYGTAINHAIKALEQTELNPSYKGVKSELKSCEDWKFYYNHGYAQAKRDLLCEDCISRAEVIKIFGEVHPLDYNKQSYIANIKKLPSVTPKAESEEQYKADLQGAYDCGYNCGYTDAMSDIYERGENE